jgi:hypothetical protein
MQQLTQKATAGKKAVDNLSPGGRARSKAGIAAVLDMLKANAADVNPAASKAGASAPA